MTILLTVIFGVALFSLVAMSLGSYVRPTTGSAETQPAATDESIARLDSAVRFAPREIHMPGLPDLSVHKPFETAASLPLPVLEAVPALLENTALAV